MADTMRKNTDAGARCGAARISVEALVMRVERRGGVIRHCIPIASTPPSSSGPPAPSQLDNTPSARNYLLRSGSTKPGPFQPSAGQIGQICRTSPDSGLQPRPARKNVSTVCNVDQGASGSTQKGRSQDSTILEQTRANPAVPRPPRPALPPPVVLSIL